MKYISAIIVAGGSGSRMGTSTKKQYLKIKDKEILVYTVECFQNMPEIQEIVVVTGKEDIAYVEKLLKDTYKLNKVSYIVAGGKERQDSVYNGIQAADEKSDYLVIHDGARPLVTEEVVRAGQPQKTLLSPRKCFNKDVVIRQYKGKDLKKRKKRKKF